MRRYLGMSLIEVMVAMGIFTVILAAVFGLFTTGDAIFRLNSGNLDMYQPLRLAMDGMTREIRQSSLGNVTIGNNNETITFKLDDVDIEYHLVGTQLMRDYSAGEQRMLAQDVNQLRFVLINSTVKIDIGSNRVVRGERLNCNLTETVRLRNGSQN